MSKNQIKIIYLFLFIAMIGIFLLFARGYFVKTPHYYTRAGIAMVFIIIGLVLVIIYSKIIISLIIDNDALGQQQLISPRDRMIVLFGSFLMVMGSYTYISIKFPDETIMKYFKQAVKEEIRKRGAEEQQYRLWKVKQRRYFQRQKQTRKEKQRMVRSAKKSKKQKTKTAAADTKIPTAVMSPPGNISVVNCSKCKRSLKLTSTERPLTIKCPFCQSIGVIKE